MLQHAVYSFYLHLITVHAYDNKCDLTGIYLNVFIYDASVNSVMEYENTNRKAVIKD